MKKLIAFTLALMLICSLAACSRGNSISSKDSDNTDISGLDLGENIVEYLGDASFFVDSANSASDEFKANGEPLVMTVTDDAGVTWTLEVPANAYLCPVEITMTALRDVTIGEGGMPASGVLLEPDGLNFIRPATLTATGGDVGENTMMLQGSHDGGNVTFVRYETAATSASATLYHFSSYFAKYYGYESVYEKYSAERTQNYWGDYDYNYQRDEDDPYDDGSVEAMARQARKAVAAAQAYLETAQIEYPLLPNLSFACDHDDLKRGFYEEKYLTEFMQEFYEPEMPLINAILNAWMERYNFFKSQIIFEEYMTDLDYECLAALRGLYASLYNKTMYLLKEYAYSEELWKAIAVASSWVGDFEKELYSKAEAFNTYEYDDGSPTDLDDIQWKREEWAGRVFEYWMKDLARNHNYSAIHSFAGIFRFNLIAGVDIPWQQYLDRIKDVLNFEIEFNAEITVCTNDGPLVYTVEGIIPVEFDKGLTKESFYTGKSVPAEIGDEELDFICRGSGVCDYTGDTRNDYSWLQLPLSYPVNLAVKDFDPCEDKKVTITVDEIAGGDSVLLTIEHGKLTINFAHTMAYGLLWIENDYGGYDDDLEESVYSFNCDLRNNEMVAVNTNVTEGFADEYGTNKVSVTLKLNHTPQGYRPLI